MAAAVSDTAWLGAMLKFEAALAAVQGRLGLIPAAAADTIAAACDPSRFDLAAIGELAIASATPVVPLVDALRQLCGDAAGRYVHHGATSHDVIDTAMMLVARDALDLLLNDQASLAATCAELAERHRGTVIAGRTLLQQALPTTFGLKAAGWLTGVVDSGRRLREIRQGGLAVQLGGAAGTLDAFGERGLQVRRELGVSLGLREPVLPWHSNRVRVAELGAALAIAAGAAAKIALDVVLLAQTEIGELAEAEPGRSSTMAHKRNPAHAIEARAAFAGLVAQATTLMSALPGEHERAAGGWQAEWPAVSEAFRLAAGTVARTQQALSGMRVDAERMRANLGPDLDPSNVGAAGALIDAALAAYRG
jgi:3-carboxy-cis,cis-muconate cycloisomerase